MFSMAHRDRGTSTFQLCVVLCLVVVPLGNCMPRGALRTSLRHSKISGTNSGKLLIGHDVTRTPGPSDVDYQADMDPFNTEIWDQRPPVEGQVDFPKQDGSALHRLLGKDPKVECTGDSMKLQVLDVAPMAGSLFFVDRGSQMAPLPLSKLPASCGYDIQSTQRETVLVAPYDGCFVTLEENSYVLPLRWWGVPVKMSCPMMTRVSTSPPMVTCHAEGMVVKTGWTLSDEIKIKLNDNWEPLSTASPICLFSVVEHQDGLVISLRYEPCLEAKDGMYAVELLGDGETRISCPSLSHAPPRPTESQTYYPEYPPHQWPARPEMPEEEIPEVVPTSLPFYIPVQQPTRQNPIYVDEKPEYIPIENPPDSGSQFFPPIYPGYQDGAKKLPPVEEYLPLDPEDNKPVDGSTSNIDHFSPPKTPGMTHPENPYVVDNHRPPIPYYPAPETSEKIPYNPYYPEKPHVSPNQKPVDPSSLLVTRSPNAPTPTDVPKKPDSLGGILFPGRNEPFKPFPHPKVPTDEIPVEQPEHSNPFIHSTEQEQFIPYPEYHPPGSKDEQSRNPTVGPSTQNAAQKVPLPFYPNPWDNGKAPEKLPQQPREELVPTIEGPKPVYPAPPAESEYVDSYEVPSNVDPHFPRPANNPTQTPERPQWYQPVFPTVPSKEPGRPTPSDQQHPESFIPLLPDCFQYNVPARCPSNCQELCSAEICHCCPQINIHQHIHHIVPPTVDGKEDLSIYDGLKFLPSLGSYGIGHMLYPSQNSQQTEVASNSGQVPTQSQQRRNGNRQFLPHTGSSSSAMSGNDQKFVNDRTKAYLQQPHLSTSQAQAYQEYQLPQNQQIGQHPQEMKPFGTKLEYLSPPTLQGPFKQSRPGYPKSDGQRFSMLQNTEASAEEAQSVPEQLSSSTRRQAEHLSKQDSEPKRYVLLNDRPPGRQESVLSESPQPLFQRARFGRHKPPNKLIRQKGEGQNSGLAKFQPAGLQKTGLNSSVAALSSDAFEKPSFLSPRMKPKIFQSWRSPQNLTMSKDS